MAVGFLACTMYKMCDTNHIPWATAQWPLTIGQWAVSSHYLAVSSHYLTVRSLCLYTTMLAMQNVVQVIKHIFYRFSLVDCVVTFWSNGNLLKRACWALLSCPLPTSSLCAGQYFLMIWWQWNSCTAVQLFHCHPIYCRQYMGWTMDMESDQPVFWTDLWHFN